MYKSFLTWFDKDSDSCIIIEIKDYTITQPLQDINLKKIKSIKPIKISVIPKANDGTGNIVFHEISREEIDFISTEGTEWHYVETKQDYKKRERELISKIIKR